MINFIKHNNYTFIHSFIVAVYTQGAYTTLLAASSRGREDLYCIMSHDEDAEGNRLKNGKNLILQIK